MLDLENGRRQRRGFEFGRSEEDEPEFNVTKRGPIRKPDKTGFLQMLIMFIIKTTLSVL